MENKTYNILDYGAETSDKIQTEKIQKALDECFLNGGGTVVVPKGVFLVAGLRLRSNTTLFLKSGAILEGSINPDDYCGYIEDKIEPIETYSHDGLAQSAYPYSRWSNAIIRAIKAENISIIGEPGSFINGMDCADPTGEEGYRGPHAISMHNCKNINFSGYTVLDSANWAHNLVECSDIIAKDICVIGGHDGFDARTCDNILIEDSAFYTGDDCIAGFDDNDVVIRNCKFNTACSVLRFGGNNVLVENCTSDSPARFGHRYTLPHEKQLNRCPTDETTRHNTFTAFLYYCDFRADVRKTPGDIIIRNCNFNGVDNLFNLEFDGKHQWCINRSLSSICFENCTASGICEPINIYGDKNEPLLFELRNVTLKAKEGFEKINLINAVNYKGINLENVKVKGFEEPVINAETPGEIHSDIKKVSCDE